VKGEELNDKEHISEYPSFPDIPDKFTANTVTTSDCNFTALHRTLRETSVSDWISVINVLSKVDLIPRSRFHLERFIVEFMVKKVPPTFYGTIRPITSSNEMAT
jgi:hypothetical protein